MTRKTYNTGKHTLATAAAGALLAAVLAALPAFAAAPHQSDSAFARQLRELGQVDLLKKAAEEKKADPVGGLYAAESVIADWSEVMKSRRALSDGTAAYLAGVKSYLDSGPANLDAYWALDQAKFIVGGLSMPIISRMEFWSNNPRDREALQERVTLVKRLLKDADEQMRAMMDKAEKANPFNEPLYMKGYDGKRDIDYNQGNVLYFEAMSMDPGTAERNDVLARAEEAITPWAEGDDENVKYPSLLLLGKVKSEAGKTLEALETFNKASDAKAPAWVQVQAKYQSVVAKMRSKDFPAAEEELATFKAWLDKQAGSPEQKADARATAEMLGYRVAWAKAQAMEPGKTQDDARIAALKILADVIEKEPKYRELVFEQLAAQVRDGDDLSKLPPLQSLAVAWQRAQTVVREGGTPDAAAEESLKGALKAAMAVRENAASTNSEKLEATLIAAVASETLSRPLDSARYKIDFAKMNPKDKRAKALLESALMQLGQIRQEGQVTPEVAELTRTALGIMTGDYFNSPEWRYAYGVTLEEQGDLAAAKKVFEEIPSKDKSFLDAQYRLVRISVVQMGKLAEKQASPAEQKRAAEELLKACTRYLKLIDSAPAEQRERVAKYLTDLRLIQISTALTPLRDHKAALDGIATLEAEAKRTNQELSSNVKGALLRYRILAYQLAGKPEEAMKEVQRLPERDRGPTIQQMVGENYREIMAVEESDPKRARELAEMVSSLLTQLVQLSTQEGKTEDAYTYRQLLADMLGKAGKTDDSIKLWLDLQKAKPADLYNYLGEARALFGKAQQTRKSDDVVAARNLYLKVFPKLPNGGEAYWEAYLRIFQLNEIDGKGVEEMKKTLRDLKVSHGARFGGELHKADFEKLLLKYRIN